MEHKKFMSRRDFLRLGVLMGGGAALAACAPQVIEKTVEVIKTVEVEKRVEVEVEKTVEVEVEKITEVEKQVGDKVITVLINGNLLTEADALVEAMLFTVHLMDYNLQKKGVTVRYEAWPGGDEYNTKVRLMTSSGEMGDTVVWGNWGSLPNYVDDQTLLPLDELMDGAGVKLAEWVPASQELMKYDPDTKTPGQGKVWALPIMGNAGAAFLFTNVDMVKAAGGEVPQSDWTLQQVEDLAVKIAKPEQKIFGLQENLWGTTHGFSWDNGYVAPFGGYIFDEAGKTCLIDSPECLEAYNWVYDSRYVRKFQGTPDDITAYGNYKEGCEGGKVAMYKMGGWGAGWFLMKPENKEPEMAFSLFPASYDGRPNGRRGNTLGLNWYGISSNAELPAECFDVLYWFNNYEAGIFAIEAGQTMPAPREDVLKDPILEKYPIVKASGEAIFTSERERGPANLRNKEAGDLLAQRMATFDTGETKPDQAFLGALAQELQAILDMPPA